MKRFSDRVAVTPTVGRLPRVSFSLAYSVASATWGAPMPSPMKRKMYFGFAAASGSTAANAVAANSFFMIFISSYLISSSASLRPSISHPAAVKRRPFTFSGIRVTSLNSFFVPAGTKKVSKLRLIQPRSGS